MHRAVVVLVVTLAFASCASMNDNATHLAATLERAAQELTASDAAESVVRYEPLGGIAQAYEIRIRPSASLLPPYEPGSGLSVTGARGGSTTYHRHFVFVPQELFIAKTNDAVQLVLRKNGERIELIELR